MTRMAGRIGEFYWALVVGQNVGMLQISGVLAHNIPQALPFLFPLFHDSGDPHGSTRHSLHWSVG